MNFIEPKIQHHFGGGVYAKEAVIPANSLLMQHAHKFDHLSILAKGSVELVVDGVKSIVHAPACITVQAGKHHGVKSLTDVTWYCIHAPDCVDEENIDDVIIAPIDNKQVREVAKLLSEGV